MTGDWLAGWVPETVLLAELQAARTSAKIPKTSSDRMDILVTPTPPSLLWEPVLSALQSADPVAGDQIRVNYSGFILASDQGHVKHPLVRRSSVPAEVVACGVRRSRMLGADKDVSMR